MLHLPLKFILSLALLKGNIMKNKKGNKEKPTGWELIDAINQRNEEQVFPDLKARANKFLSWVQSLTEKNQSDNNQK